MINCNYEIVESRNKASCFFRWNLSFDWICIFCVVNLQFTKVIFIPADRKRWLMDTKNSIKDRNLCGYVYTKGYWFSFIKNLHYIGNFRSNCNFRNWSRLSFQQNSVAGSSKSLNEVIHSAMPKVHVCYLIE